VKKEFDSLSDDSKVFKMVGPVLLKQEKSEALGAVNGRLEFIAKSIKDTEDRIKELQGSSEVKRSELMQLQQKMQSAAQGQVAG
jgi:prefoldin beta subunit